MAIRVLIVDDHSMVRQGLLMYFEDDPDIEIVGEARNGMEALQLAQTLQPQVILMDILMPVMDGVAATATLRRQLPHTNVVAMTSVVEEDGVRRAVQAGAVGYVLKDTGLGYLSETLRDASLGRVRFPPEAITRVLREVTTPDVDPGVLSESQRRVLALLGQGLSTAEIAEAVGCSIEAADQMLQQVLDLLGLSGRMQAALYAVRHNLGTL